MVSNLGLVFGCGNKGPPDFRHCVVQQKLQLLCCCIERKAAQSQEHAREEKGMAVLSPSRERVGRFRKKVRQLVTGDADTGIRQSPLP